MQIFTARQEVKAGDGAQQQVEKQRDELAKTAEQLHGKMAEIKMWRATVVSRGRGRTTARSRPGQPKSFREGSGAEIGWDGSEMGDW
ncbi:hypothetical protein MMC29_004923 [Sticta canariensis]|nr:hypothetical protein [Sticta canariensis]